MSWRDNLIEGSFRGVPFVVEGTTAEVGRHTARHVFPGDGVLPVVEDLSLRARLHAFECFVIGDDYLDGMDALVKAVEEPGSGTLAHPTWGEITVTVDGPVYVKESITNEGGIARFTISFTQVKASEAPAVRKSTQDELAAACEEAQLEAIEEFDLEFEIASALQWVVANALAVINAVLDQINRVRAIIQSAIDAVDTITQAVGLVKDAINSLLSLPGQLAGALAALYSSVFGWLASDDVRAPASAERSIALIETLIDSLASSPVEVEPATTPSEQLALDNAAAVAVFTDTLVAIEASRASASVPFESYDQAAGLRDIVLEAIDAVLPRASDRVYRSLVRMRTALIEHLNSVASTLPQERSYVPPTTTPALALAYRLYGDAARAEEIVGRNRVQHPGFVPGGAALKVLANE